MTVQQNASSLQDFAIKHTVPLYAHIDATYRCDLRCVHCYLDEYKSQYLSFERLCGIMDELAEAGCMFLTFSGGEAFARSDMMELLRHARKRHFYIHLKTHAGKITPEIADQLAELEINLVMVSLYSLDPAANDAITTRPGSHQRTMRGIQLMLDRGLEVRIATSVMGQNFDGFRELFYHFQRKDVIVDLSTYIMKTREGIRQQGHLALTDEQVREVYEFRVKNPATAGIFRHLAKGFKCMAGVKSLYIDPKGLVHPCTIWSKPLGDLTVNSFSEIWHSQFLENWREFYEKDDVAACPAANLTETGNVFVPSKQYKQFNRILRQVRDDHETAGAASGCRSV